MFKYVLAGVVIILCLVFLQKGCERMRNARWDRQDKKREERKENREERKQDRFWNRDEDQQPDNSHRDRRHFIWRRREHE
jgi:hypothetical protein